MITKIVDYTLDSSSPANPDASCPATTVGSCPVVAGPHATTLGDFPKALNFGPSGELVTTLPVSELNRSKFAVRLVFKVDAAVTATQTLAESNALPFNFSIAPSSGGSDFFLVASVTTSSFDTGSASTKYFLDLHLATWYAADLVYDTDTLAVFVDGVIYSVHAFPEGTIAAATADKLFIGRTGSNTNQFSGKMAALQFLADIPLELETQLDEFRSHPQWFLTYKEEEIKYTLGLGVVTGEFYFDFANSSWVQPFTNGILMYSDANGQAFAMHGAILAMYYALPIRAAIGYLVSDEMPGARGGSRKSLFSGGGIYWSSQTGAIPVIGQIWVDYESHGESAWIGLPTAAEVSIGGGRQQVFQNAQIYWRSGSARAFMVMGAILAKFLSTGGTRRVGLPSQQRERHPQPRERQHRAHQRVRALQHLLERRVRGHHRLRRHPRQIPKHRRPDEPARLPDVGRDRRARRCGAGTRQLVPARKHRVVRESLRHLRVSRLRHHPRHCRHRRV